MDKFASLGAFVEVVEEGGFAAAARKIGLSRSQVNKLVLNLEDHLGTQLLVRTTRSVAPTPEGRALYERAKVILNDLAEAETALHDDREEPQGELKINAPMSFGTMHLSTALPDFMTRFPKVRIQLVLSDEFIDPVLGGFDVTVRVAEPSQSLALIEHQIVEAKRVICASPEFIESHGMPDSPADLKQFRCLHYGNLPSGNMWRLVGPEGARSIEVNGVLCSNNGEILRDAAVQGLGLALLPTFIAGADLQAGRLVRAMTSYEAPPLYLSLLYPPHRHLSTRIRKLVEFFYERFGGRPYWDLIT